MRGAVDGSGARLVLVAGGDVGRVFTLEGPSPPEGWVIGRARAAHVQLADDPYVDTSHARILERGGAHVVVGGGAGARTFHNWRLLSPNAEAILAPGDLVGVGMSLLLYRPG